MKIQEILKSLEREPAKLKMDDTDIVRNGLGEEMTFAQSKIRLDNCIKKYGFIGSIPMSWSGKC